MGTVLGGLLLPKFDTFDYGRSMNQGILGATQQVQGQTALLTLQEEREKQAAQALIFERVKNDPELARQLLGGSTIGSLPTTSAAPPGGALTQQAFGPTGPSGPAQAVPGGQDLSRFAEVSPQGGGPIPPGVMGQVMPQAQPPQSVLGSLGPAGQSQQMPAPQNPLLEMARTNPRAAMMLQQQMQQQQDAALTRQSNLLKARVQTVDYLARMAQGATDQDSWKVFLEEADRVQPGAGARLPQTYSKEARDRVVAQGFDAKETMTLQLEAMKAQTNAGTLALAQQKALREQANVPNFTGEAPLNAAIYTRLQGRDFSTLSGAERAALVADARKDVQEGKVTVAERTGAAQEALKPLGETATLRFNTLTQAEDTIKKLTTEFTPEERAKFVGMGGMTMAKEQLVQLWADVRGGKADPKFARFAALVALAKAEAFSTAGKALTETESGVVYGYIPTGKEYSAEEFEQKLKLAQERVPSMLDRELQLATTPRSELPGMRARGELGASTTKPTSQAPAATPQGPATFDRADFLRWRQSTGKSGNPTQADVEAYFQAKGLKRR